MPLTSKIEQEYMVSIGLQYWQEHILYKVNWSSTPKYVAGGNWERLAEDPPSGCSPSGWLHTLSENP